VAAQPRLSGRYWRKQCLPRLVPAGALHARQQYRYLVCGTTGPGKMYSRNSTIPYNSPTAHRSGRLCAGPLVVVDFWRLSVLECTKDPSILSAEGVAKPVNSGVLTITPLGRFRRHAQQPSRFLQSISVSYPPHTPHVLATEELAPQPVYFLHEVSQTHKICMDNFV
jgi:hypothetical protein